MRSPAARADTPADSSTGAEATGSAAGRAGPAEAAVSPKELLPARKPAELTPGATGADPGEGTSSAATRQARPGASAFLRPTGTPLTPKQLEQIWGAATSPGEAAQEAGAQGPAAGVVPAQTGAPETAAGSGSGAGAGKAGNNNVVPAHPTSRESRGAGANGAR